MSFKRKLTTLVAVSAFVLSFSAPATALSKESAPEDGLTIVLTDSNGRDQEVTAKEFKKLADNGSLDELLALDSQKNESQKVSTRAIVAHEGNIYKSIKLYFNKDETNRIAVGSGLCYTVISNFAGKGALVLKPACLGLTAYASSAIVTGSCVGIAKSSVPAFPYPIYHKGKKTCF